MVGQVPVNVTGKVLPGNFIAAGSRFGLVTAISEKEMTPKRFFFFFLEIFLLFSFLLFYFLVFIHKISKKLWKSCWSCT